MCKLGTVANILADKGFNLFDERAARCLHLSSQEARRVHLFFLKGQCLKIHIWQYSKLTDGANANKINKTVKIVKIVKIRILVEQELRHFK